MSESQPKGQDHHAWKGEDVKYAALHEWVARLKTKTGVCSGCGRERPTQWANISGAYLRNLADFAELCQECHGELDGRMKLHTRP